MRVWDIILSHMRMGRPICVWGRTILFYVQWLLANNLYTVVTVHVLDAMTVSLYAWSI